MMRSILATLAALVVGMPTLDAYAVDHVQSPDPSGAGHRRALLVGINDYPGDKQDLKGCVPDVLAIKRLLVGTYGFAERDIVVLADAEATRAKWLGKLRELVRVSGPRDTVVLHYSGHGTQLPDPDGEEKDQKDEVFIPVDWNTKGVIRDDEFGEIIDGFETDNVVILFDCCHSGDATRDLITRDRNLTPEDAMKVLAEAGIRSDPTRSLEHDPLERFLVLSAAQSTEKAKDLPNRKPTPNGLFTLALTQVLFEDPGALVERLHTSVRARMRKLLRDLGSEDTPPHPQFRSRDLNRPLLVPIARTADAGAVKVRVKFAGGEAEQVASLQQALPSYVAGFTAVADDPRLVVRMTGTRCMVAAGDGGQVLGGADIAPPDTLAARIAPRISRALGVLEFLQTTNPGATLAFEVAVDGRREFTPRTPGAPRTAENSVQLRVRASADCDIALVAIDAEGRITTPGRGRGSAGEWVLLPGPSTDRNRPRFHLDLAPPAGHHTYLLVATTERSRFRGLVGDLRALARGEQVPDLQARLGRGAKSWNTATLTVHAVGGH